MWPKRLCHNEVEFSFNFCFVPLELVCSILLQKLKSSLYKLSIKKIGQIIFEFWKRLTLLFPKEQ